MNTEPVLDEIFQISEAVKALSRMVEDGECKVGTAYILTIIAWRLKSLYEDAEATMSEFGN